MDIYTKIHEVIAAGKGGALCTIIETSGSTPRKAGSKMVVTSEGKTFGSVGGGKLERNVIKDVISCISSGKNKLASYDSGENNEGTAYGKASVFIEVLQKNRQLYIFGAGHVGQAVATISSNYGFDVKLIDPRQELLELISIEGIQKINSAYLDAVDDLSFDTQTYIVVATNTHSSDEAVTYACSKQAHAYLGMIGSKKKIAEARSAFVKRGMDAKQLENIDMPIGVPINCETPAEIAISILARLIDVKNA